MKTLKKSSTAIITTLVLGLLPALPAAAQTAPETTAARKDSVQVFQAERGGQDSPMKFTVTQKTGTDNEEVIIRSKGKSRTGKRPCVYLHVRIRCHDR